MKDFSYMKKLTNNYKKIIDLLADYPETQFFTKEISDKTGVSLGGAHNALKQLAKEKIVALEAKGNMKFYQIYADNPQVKQFRVADAIDRIMPLIDQIKSDCLKIVLFGSTARGEQTSDSDIDLFILTHEPETIKKKFFKSKIKRQLKTVIKTPNQWSELEIKEPEFFQEVSRGIKLFQL
jgi:predicted nucleotidyltransferase